jgi:hypothetical protein
LYGQLQPYPATEYLLQWWPLIFVLLGLEVLLQAYFNKVEDGRVKYDIFSIFIVFIIVMAGLFLQTASHLGLADYVQKNIIAERFYLQADQEIAVGKHIQRLVIKAERCSKLDLRTAQSDTILCNTQVAIQAASRSEAEQELANQVLVKSSTSGNTMYLRLGPDSGAYDGKYSLVLPQRLAVEIEHDTASLEIANARPGNDWLIKGSGRTDISLASPADVLVSVLLPQEQNVAGNLNWTTREEQTAARDTTNNDAVQEHSASRGIDRYEAIKTMESKMGNGLHKMTIIHQHGTITINQLP